MSAAPKKVFILENDEYVEITNEEHCQRKEHDRQYSKPFHLIDLSLYMTLFWPFLKDLLCSVPERLRYRYACHFQGFG